MNDFLKRILEIDSPSGYTKHVQKFLIEELKKIGYNGEISKKGSIYIHIDVNKPSTACVSAHVDTLGLIVRSFNADGTINVSNIGGPILSTINGEYCTLYTRDNKKYRGTILNKNRAIHVHKDARSEVLLDNIIVRLDEKVSCKKDLENLGISVGDFVCYDAKVEFVNDYIKSRFLDDKAGVCAIYNFLKNLDTNSLNQNLLIYFSVYEEVGHGGTNTPHPVDEYIAVDMGCVGEDLNGNEFSVSICAKDSLGPYDYELTSRLIEKAKILDIDYVVDVYPMYSSDGSAFLRGGNDAKVALIGPGVDASHGMERTSLIAIENTSKLLEKYLTN
ncbi:MAG: M42 family metallopeptidase [Bacilli bacterium]